jgi:glycosyltransferase involved in cell wall biosynthesis
MKILIVAHETRPIHGWGRYTNDLARALRDVGHEVVVLSEWLKENGGTRLSDPDTYLGYGLGWVKDRSALSRAVAATHPDVIHVTVEPYLNLIPLVHIPSHTKLFLTVHGTYAYYPKLMPRVARVWGRLLYTYALDRVHSVIPVSHNTARVYVSELAEYQVSKPRISVIHNGVWMKDHSLPTLGAAEKHGFTILSVGAIKARKGILEVVRGIGELKKQFGIKAQYRIVGPVDNLDAFVDRIKTTAQEYGVLEQLVFTGALYNAALEEELRRAHVLALLPRAVGNSLEGFGLVYLEANAYGVPALGARGTVSEEAIKEAESGLLCNADDPTDIAAKLHMLVGASVDPEQARAWAAAHDWSVIVREYEKLYNS